MAGEAKLERAARAVANRLDVLNYKVKVLGIRGFPDCIFFPGNGRVFLVEFKNPNKLGILSALQRYLHHDMLSVGIAVYVCNDLQDFETILKEEVRNART